MSEATFVVMKKMEKIEFRVLVKHFFLAKKVEWKPKNGLINIIRTLHQGNQPLKSGLQNFKPAI